MAKIHLLDNNTIDKIAAGEVVERPSSVVKELVENSIDSGATIITVEIKDGGLKLIRVSDNGCGIDKDQIRNAFCSHATSKINDVDDLNHLFTLGFRGEALSSISAVSRVEVTTRTADSMTGIHYICEGGIEEVCEEVGTSVGTQFLVRDLFYNTLPRLKFLKSSSTEASYVADLMEHLALSQPNISFQFINNGKVKFSTSGRGDLREVVYRIFGKETSEHIRKIEYSDIDLHMKVYGFLGLPSINRSNRNSEIFFVNHRYVKSNLISRAVEEGYVEYLMQHKFPFCILNLEFNPEKIDVNVHPTKQEVRISEEKIISEKIVHIVAETLREHEMVDSIVLEEIQTKTENKDISLPQSFEQNRIKKNLAETPDDLPNKINTLANNTISVEKELSNDNDVFFVDNISSNDSLLSTPQSTDWITPELSDVNFQQKAIEYKQLDFYENEEVLTPSARRQYKIIGQLFKTYWLIEYDNSLLIMDQHAAHEKVNFERLMRRLNEKEEIPSQIITPPIVMSLTNREMQILLDNLQHFTEIGFDINKFGEHEIAIRSIPMDLYDSKPEEMVHEIITDLYDLKKGQTPNSIRNRIATMACKASVKGNTQMNVSEIEQLLDEMLTLDNPYNCPHGRPTMITFSKNEMEKRFHRIV